MQDLDRVPGSQRLEPRAVGVVIPGFDLDVAPGTVRATFWWA